MKNEQPNETVVMFTGVIDNDDAYKILLELYSNSIFPGSMHVLQEIDDDNFYYFKDNGLILPKKYFEILGEL